VRPPDSRLADRQTPNCLINTIGTGTAGYSGDPNPNKVQFNRPTGLALDTAGNLVVADSGNHVIRGIKSPASPLGSVSLLAGQPNKPPGAEDGVAMLALFNNPVGVAFASRIYVADQLNHKIRRISETYNVVDSLTGSGSLCLAQIDQPTGIVVGSNAIYVADPLKQAIRIVKKNPTTDVCTSVDDLATTAALAAPRWLAMLGTTLYVTDGDGPSSRVVAIDTNTTGYFVLGQSHLSSPAGIVVTKSGGVIVADRGNHRVVLFPVGGGTAPPTALVDGNAPCKVGLSGPTGLALSSDESILYIADTENHVIRAVKLPLK
jgi:DNA-binding beta-propeller fold protein YncE